MTDIERAIETLKDMKSYFNDRSHRQYSMPAINLAISALEHQLTNGWIPVTERLPEDIKGNGLVTVLACLKSKDDSLFFSDNTVYQEVTDYITDTQEWEIDNGYEVLAWQPLPEPYEELATDYNVVTKSGKDNNVLTIGDKIRESNESLAKFIETITYKCIRGKCLECQLYKACDREDNAKDIEDYLNQPYTE